MSNERKRVLKMVEDGTITAEEALTLLEALGKSSKANSNETFEKVETQNIENEQDTETFKQEKNESNNRKEDASMDDFLENLRRDFVHVGDRFMNLMQSAVQKVKTFDFDSPFGNAVSFEQTLTKSGEGVQEVFIDIDNGKVEVYVTEEEEIRAEFLIKAYNKNSEEQAREEFLEKLLFVLDDGKLRIISDWKLVQANLSLYLPQKLYEKFSIKLLNGSYSSENANVKNLRIKTTNGKVEVKGLTFEDVDIETANGAVRLTNVIGNTLKAETLNGRVYVDGEVKSVKAESLNGHVVVTTRDVFANSIEAKTLSGAVEIYVPSSLAIAGQIASNMGRLDLQLDDVTRSIEQDQFLQRSIRFTKEVEGKETLKLVGESKTGTVLVCYTIN